MKMKSLKLSALALSLVLIGACATTDKENSKQEKAKQELLATGTAYSEMDFIKAAANGNMKVVKLFLESGMNIDVSINETPLIAATARKKTKMIQFLLDNGANVNIDNYLGSPLTLASRSGLYDVAKLFIEHGANVNYVAGNHFTPLCFAARYGHAKVIQLLVEHGGDVNYIRPVTGDTPLITAAYFGHLAAVKQLVESGANINYRDFNDMSVLDWACIGSAGSTIPVYLIENGADVKMHSNNTVPKAMLEALALQNKDLIKLLIDRGISVNGNAYGKLSILAWCAKNNLPKSGEYLVELGADTLVKTKEGLTALDYAIENNEYKLAKIIDPSIDVTKLPAKVVDPNIQSSQKIVNSMIAGQYYKAEPTSSKAQAEPFGIQPLAPVTQYGGKEAPVTDTGLQEPATEQGYQNIVEPDQGSVQELFNQGSSMHNIDVNDYGNIDKQLNEDMKSIDASLSQPVNNDHIKKQNFKQQYYPQDMKNIKHTPVPLKKDELIDPNLVGAASSQRPDTATVPTTETTPQQTKNVIPADEK